MIMIRRQPGEKVSETPSQPINWTWRFTSNSTKSTDKKTVMAKSIPREKCENVSEK
jgi:hypothetical protein